MPKSLLTFKSVYMFLHREKEAIDLGRSGHPDFLKAISTTLEGGGQKFWGLRSHGKTPISPAA